MVGSGSFYDDGDVHRRYREHRDGEPRLSPNHVMEEPAVLDQVGDPTGLRVLDLGCGDGRFGRQLLRAGAASYRGIDGSTPWSSWPGRTCRHRRRGRTRRSAQRRPDPCVPRLGHGATVVALPARTRSGPGDRCTGARSGWPLRVHGRAPCHHQPRRPVDRAAHHLDGRRLLPHGPRRRAWMGSEVVWHHRTVEDHVRSVTDAGLTLTALQECAPRPERFDGHDDELARRRRVPLFLLIAARV